MTRPRLGLLEYREGNKLIPKLSLPTGEGVGGGGGYIMLQQHSIGEYHIHSHRPIACHGIGLLKT